MNVPCPTIKNVIEFPNCFVFESADGAAHRFSGVVVTVRDFIIHRAAILDGTRVAMARKGLKGFAYKNGTLNFELRETAEFWTSKRYFTLVCDGKDFAVVAAESPFKISIPDLDALPFGPVNELIDDSPNAAQLAFEQVLHNFPAKLSPTDVPKEEVKKTTAEQISLTETHLNKAFSKVRVLSPLYYFWLGVGALSIFGIPGLVAFHQLIRHKESDLRYTTGSLIFMTIGVGATIINFMEPIVNHGKQVPDMIVITVLMMGLAGLLMLIWLHWRLDAVVKHQKTLADLRAWLPAT